jgi:hypothetical protein
MRRPHLSSLGALLWLRNHYEKNDPTLRDRVLQRIDKLLLDYDVGALDSEAFRKEYPSEDF